MIGTKAEIFILKNSVDIYPEFILGSIKSGWRIPKKQRRVSMKSADTSQNILRGQYLKRSDSSQMARWMGLG
ncbi:hypothetical protein HF690_08600 [Oleiagrimonas citrea]|uniref:Uncharacterized protein n=1 Tax=Oleiagrimonas citrea TaxID=1665687 RepID=A0A846ZN89_9GAMM|nr:hypothetical protein [Oleiagrimonas citrea]NKZ39008.1 hypothetical protein [Oleiagrimonas citrea]